MNFSGLNTHFSYTDFLSSSQTQTLKTQVLHSSAIALLALCIIKQSQTGREGLLRPLVEAGKIGAASVRGALDGLYHGTGSFIEGIFSGTLSAHIALALRVGTEDSYLSPKSLTYLESKIFAGNEAALRIAENHINPLVQIYFNTSCLRWFFDGLVTAPILHLVFHPPSYASKHGAQIASQIESTACYLGLVDPKGLENPRLKQAQETAAFLAACLVSGSLSILTGIISYNITQDPEFPKNVIHYASRLQEMVK